MKNRFSTLALLSCLIGVSSMHSFALAADSFAEGCAKYSTGDFDGAKRNFLAHVKAKPTAWKAYYQLANCYVQLKDQPNALKAYQNCIKNKPSADVKANCDKAIAYLSANSLNAPPVVAPAVPPASAPAKVTRSVAISSPSDSGSAAKDELIQKRKAQIMADAEIQANRIREETKGTIENLKASSNQYYRSREDGSIRIEANPEDVSRVQNEGEQRINQIMDDAKRHAMSVTSP
jgi:tetratricopeptide (TPR) repeat protein